MAIAYHYNTIQGTDEWYDLRRGILTASEAKFILTPGTLTYARNDKQRAHVYEIAAQRISNYTEPHYISDDMMRGKDDEFYARLTYSEKIAPVTEVGFVTNDTYGFKFGYSPDGLVGDDGLIEIKSRRQKFQIETIVKDKMPEEFLLQVQSGLLITGREWCDFISYHGGLPMFPKRIYADEEVQKAIIGAGKLFEEQVCEVVEKYAAQIVYMGDQMIPTERRIEQEIIA